MRSETAAAYCDEPSVEAFLPKVKQGAYPSPCRHVGILPNGGIRKRRQRRPSPELITKTLKAAKDAGCNPSGAVIAADGSIKLTFGEPECAVTPLEEWKRSRAR
jgi:hypothetical protein